jgi:Putative rhamnosyl transferase
MQSEFTHFVITRIGLGIYDEDRLNKMIDLFAVVTLPSIKRQTRQEFVWLIVVDAACPVACKNKILSLIAGNKNYHCMPIDLTNVIYVRLACFDWVWDRCQAFILENQLINSSEEYVITSIIDADDAWNRETTATVDRLVVNKMPEVFEKKDSRGTWLRHSVGLTITFPDGYVWFISARKFWPLKNEFRSMSVFVVARFSSGISACSCRHTQWRKYSEILEFEILSPPSKEPMWVYSRHDETVESWNARQGMQMPTSFDNRLENMFGIEYKRVEKWLLDHPPKEATEKQFNPSAALQYDLMFRIAALNRQIQGLVKGGTCNDVNSGRSNDSLSEAQAERERLIRELQRGRR